MADKPVAGILTALIVAPLIIASAIVGIRRWNRSKIAPSIMIAKGE